jgi:hypothetical protein
MVLRGALFFTLALANAGHLSARPPLRDPLTLNIGVNCQWQKRCMAAQRRSMKHAIAYIRRYHPPQWRIALCNRNARRSVARIDWVGFDHCIANVALRPAGSRPTRRHR